jgi:type I restriction enzyme M protein
VIDLYEKYADVEGLSTVIDVDEITKNEYNLNISRYVKKKRVVEEIDLKVTLKELEHAYDEFIQSEEKMKELLAEVKIL